MMLKRLELHNFFGFRGPFETMFDRFTVLVGPNNGGKTSVLRAIKFALDSFRTYFGDGREPALARLAGDWHRNLSDVGPRLGIQDQDLFFYGRSRHSPSSVTLTFESESGEVKLGVRCDSGRVGLTLQHNGRPLNSVRDATSEAVVKALYEVQTQLVPPLGTLSPTERELPWPHLDEQLAAGRYAETWRNQLHWLNEGQSPDQFQKVARVIRDHLGDVDIRPPRRTREHNPPNVVVDYREDGVDYDIAAGGGGLRTLVTLAAAVELSPARILLLDEPDAHLHSSLQRRVARLLLDQTGPHRQVIVSTHAPDLIDEVPVESLRWVDRAEPAGQPCDDVGKTLVRLGAVSQSQAIQSLGADVVLYFEARPDRTSLTAMLKRCGKEHLVNRARLAVLKGFGDIQNLPGALRILKALLPMKVAVAAIRDADYTQPDPRPGVDDQGDLLLLTLPVKELENLLLLSPRTIADTARKAAEARQTATNQVVPSPTQEEVEEKIAEFTLAADVRNAIEDQWLFRWCEMHGGLSDAGQLTEARRQFEARWQDLSWRRRCCPGKMVLTHIRQWLQAEPWKLSLSLTQLFAATEPDSELTDLFDKLEAYVVRETSR